MAVAGFLLLLFMVNLRPGVSAAHFNYTSSPRKPKWDSRYFPNPILHPVQCGRVNKSFVCDPEKILLPIQAKQLDDLISSKTNTFKCVCKEKCVSYRDKYVIMVAIAPRIKVKKGATMEEKKLAVDTFAKDLLERGWAGGNCDNDIIIVLSTEYRRMHAVAKKRIQKFLSEGCLQSLVNASADALSDGFFRKAVYDFVDRLSLDLQREECIDLNRTSALGMSTPPWVIYVVGGIVSIVFMLLLIFGIKKCRRYQRRRGERAQDTGPTVVYRPASRELVEQYEGNSPANSTGYAILTENAKTQNISLPPRRTSKSHGDGHGHYEHISSHDSYDGQVSRRGGPDGGVD